jgi:hypothetical protein
MSAKTTKKTPVPAKRDPELRSEYRFDYSRSKPNRFASRAKVSVAVLLDPDVAAVFKTAESVNSVLRSVISVLPVATKSKPIRSRKAV